MINEHEFEMPNEFGEKTADELLNEFLEECPVTEDSYINVFGAYYQVMTELLPTSRNVLVWMAFNSELDRGRVIIQSINLERILGELGISRTAYFKSLRDLKEHDVIRGGDAEYFINPRFVWRGSDKRRHKFMAKYPYIENVKTRNNELKTTEF
jgi:hypothetical protein